MAEEDPQPGATYPTTASKVEDKIATVMSNSTVRNATGNSDMLNNTLLQVLVPSIWGIIVVIGALGNIIVIFTMCRRSKGFPRTATNCYIVNVALADLAFILIVVPLTTAAYVSDEWIYGEVMCKLQNYIIYVTLLSTCLTLTAMTIDRYFAIVHPIRSLRRRTPKVAAIICMAIWLTCLALCSPYLQVFEVDRVFTGHVYLTLCKAAWPNGWEKPALVIVVLLTYIIPLTIIVGSYTLILRFLWRHRIGTRKTADCKSEASQAVMGGGTTIANRRKKVAKMVAAVVILFAITWLPIHLFNLCFLFVDNFPRNMPMYYVKIFAHTLSYTGSCVNPFVYTIMGDGFRKAFREALPVCSSSNSPQSMRTHFTRRTVSSTAETRFHEVNDNETKLLKSAV
ncbi:orphan G-protein coupled receptor 54 [Plakobranchus ocellatus]|uniref:Orphan G-protein coupled receptor 54 n=1 Tax=Plakobranchus ocellatus TaxID=259542 RepID=A0AAV4AKF3_9GAST|nr:orphan G-protein coupled receptor 54 [Plakobranchus ocellatus]